MDEEELGLEPGAVHVDQDPDPGVALAEEEVTDDRPDHGQTGGDPQAGEDRRQGGRELQLPQPGQAPGSVQGE